MESKPAGRKCLLLLFIIVSTVMANAQNLNNPNKQGPLGTQVNTLSGNLFMPRTDIYIPARGFDMDITFYYNSYFFNEEMGFGKGWSFMYAIKYKNDTVPGGKIIFWGDGREDTYDSLPGGIYKTPQGFFSNLVQYQPGKFRLTETDSTTYFFDNAIHKKITRVQEPNGNFINFNYTDSLLTTMVNAAGQTVSFTYNASGRLATVVDAVATPSRTYTYSYDAAGNLKEVTDPLGGKFSYTYLINGPMKTLADKNNNKIDIIYFPDFSARELIGCNKRISFSYDTGYNKTVVTDHFDNGGANQVTTYTYQRLGDLSWISSMSGNCCGFNVKFEYDDQGNQTKLTDANGNVYQYTYDSKGNMLTMKDPLNQVSTYTYSSNYNKITGYTDPKGFIYTMSYDAIGNMIQLVTPGNNIFTAAYNSNGDITSSTDPKGNVFTYNYDAFGNPSNVTGPNGYTATLSFDARGNLLSYTDARSNNSTAEYDILDRLKKITDPINNQVQFTYDANGNMVTYKNENNETTIINYDASNRVVKLTGPTGNQANMSYDAMNNLKSVKNALGHETKYNYDTRNRPTAVKDPENNNNQYNYDANGNVTSVVMANGRTTTYTYDQLNRVTAVNDNSGTIASLSYDKNNNVTSFTNGTGATVTALYDSLDRIKNITDPLGNSTAYTYDKNNNITSVTDREGRVSFYTYDSLDRIKTFTDNNGFVITAGYDAMNNVTSLKDQNNNTTTYTYDNLNRRNTMTYPGGSFLQYGYDNKGNLTSKRLTDGTIITYQYDTLNRVTSRTLPGGEVYSYIYDKLNRVTAATNNSGTVTFTYDALNRVKSESFDGRTTSYNYNIAGRTQTTIYPDNATVIKEFDTRNRLIKIMKDSVTVVEYAYNNANQPTNKTFANGVSSTMQYDFANRLSSITTGTIQNTTFTYDKEMNKTAINRLNDPSLSEQFTYDNGYRLTNYKRGPVGSPTIQNSYTYDAVGNRTAANLNGSATTYSINNLNQLTGVNATGFNFDSRGNITYDGIFYKTYDAEGRLLKDSSSPASVIVYSYDALNRRVTKTTNGNPLKYTYSGATQIEERDGSNLLLNRTVFTNFLSPVLNEKNGNQFYYHQNELNSVEAISNSYGNLIESYRYDAYGKLSRYDSLDNPLASSIAGNRFGFTGQEYESISGSYRFFYRNYSPETGVFNQRDLIEYEDGMGMYQYVGNNPANGVDVLGLYGSYESFNPEFGPQSYEHWQGADPNFNAFAEMDKFISGAFSKGNYALGMAERFTEKFSEKATYTIEKIGECGMKFKGTLRTYKNNAWAQMLLGKNHAKDILYNAEKSIVKNATALKNNAKGLVNGAGSKISSLGKKLGIAEFGYKGAKLRYELGNGISPAGQSEWNALGEFAVSGLTTFTPAGAVFGNADFLVEAKSGKNSFQHANDFVYDQFMRDEQRKQLQRVKDSYSPGSYSNYSYNSSNNYSSSYTSTTSCPPPGGTRKPPGSWWESYTAAMQVFVPVDPNLIIGPDGQPTKKWVSVNDRMPYTILFENDSTATARTRYIKITTPIEPKQDATTLELGSFGFNNQSFDIPQGTSSYYQRLDCRDSTGLFVDITAGYDVINNQVFWEFQGIDPITLLPPEDPLAGFLFLQDTTQPNYGNGFVNFTTKPITSALTLDTIGARAFIVFDQNEVIPTNIHTNTIDAFAPVSHMNVIPATTNPITLSWTGADDTNGSGIDYYTIYVSSDQVNYSVLIPRISSTDTTFSLPPDSTYCFFVLATDRTGNKETLRPGEIKCTYLGPPLPVTWLHFRGKTVEKNNLLDWATANEQNTKQYNIERSLNGTSYSRIGIVNAVGNSNQTNAYQYTDHDIDRLNSEYMFYRLKQIDIDGKFQYSNVVRLRYNDKNTGNTIVYPNPTPGRITILVGDNALVGTMAVLYDINGRLLENIKITASSQPVDLGKYVNGVYFIKLVNNEVLKIIRQ